MRIHIQVEIHINEELQSFTKIMRRTTNFTGK